MAIGIEDIAKITNLSIGTISNYLNGKKIRDKNKILIEQAISESGYIVNTFGRTLKTNKSGTIGIMVPNLDDIYTSKIVSLVEKKLRENNYAVMISATWCEDKSENEVIQFFLSRRVEGVIIFPFNNDHTRYDVFNDNGIAICFIDLKVDNINSDFVAINNRISSKKGVEYLISKGHKDIAILCGPENLYSADERLNGYLDALKEHDIQINSKNIIRGDCTKEISAYNVVFDLLNREKLPTAIFAANYFFTIGAIGAINSSHLVLGRDISLLGFDNLMSQYLISTKLSIIEQPMEKIANKAAELLLDRINKPINNSREELIDGYLTIGKSVNSLNYFE